ncbi:hypothetical protein [Streptomyces sp. ActVer]|uniref:hypothetical protein n=1 Tax=Streptomyces sp. ActVer TaxID=3014558 RepID=UPI002F961D77
MAAQHLEPRVLVHTRTTDYRHESIPDGIAAVRSLGAAHGFTVHASEAYEDPAFRQHLLGGIGWAGRIRTL